MVKLTHQSKIPKFLEIYINFTEIEKKRFKKLALSTYFNRKRNNLKLLTGINQALKQNSENKSLNINELIIQNTGLSKRALWNRLSDLTGIAESFMIIEKFENNKLVRQKLLIAALRERKLNSLIDLQKNAASKMSKSSKIGSDTYFNFHSIFENISRSLSDTNNYSDSLKYNSIQSEYSVLQFLLHLFKQNLDLELQEINNVIINDPVPRTVLNKLEYTALLNSIRPNFPVQIVPVDIYYNLYLAFSKNLNELHFYAAKNIFLYNKEMFTEDFKNEIYQSLRNYCIFKTNKGQSEFYKEIFDLNNMVLEEGLFKDLNVVNSQTNNFRNFIFAALRLNEYEWVKRFIDNYSVKLPDDIRGDEINLSNGILYLHEKKYDLALSSLSRVSRKKYLQYLDTSIYKLMIFYETDEIEDAYKESARLKNYILKHRDIPGYLKGSYKRFIGKFDNLLKLNQKPERTNIEYYIDEMEKIKNIGLGNWLYERSKELLTGIQK